MEPLPTGQPLDLWKPSSRATLQEFTRRGPVMAFHPIVAATALATLAAAAPADDAGGYVTETPFLMIEETSGEAEAWATCAAAMNLYAELAAASGLAAQAKQMGTQANGAVLAVGMCHVSDLINGSRPDDLDSVRSEFDSTWSYARHAMRFLPETQMTIMVADAEQWQSLEDGEDVFVRKLVATLNTCASNRDAQRMYVDLWREMQEIGWLRGP